MTASIAFETHATMREVCRVMSLRVQDWPISQAGKDRVLAGLADYRTPFDAFICATDACEHRLKPHRDLYSLALSHMALPKSDYAFCVGLEDTEPGIISLRAAGIGTLSPQQVDALNAWIVEDTAPPTADRLEVAGEPAAFVLDDLGNVKGGVRTPYVDAPIAKLSGEGQLEVSAILDVCGYSGTTKLFDAATLGSLYADNAAYIDAVNTAADDAVSKGFLRPADAQLIKDYAVGSDIFAP